MGVRADLFEALATRLAAISGIKTVEWNRIRISESDFADHELPAIQFYAGMTSYTHQQGQVQAATQIAIEVILRDGDGGGQADLLDLMETVEQAIGSDPTFGISNMIHMAYLSDEVDLHSIDPFRIGRLTFEALYRKPYVRLC